MRTLYLKLLGLSRACDNNEHMLTADTFALVREVLEAEEALPDLFDRLKAEKLRVAPMCADCQSPCGRTADPEDSLFDDKEMLAIDLELLERLLRCGLAFYGEAELERLLKSAAKIYQ